MKMQEILEEIDHRIAISRGLKEDARIAAYLQALYDLKRWITERKR